MDYFVYRHIRLDKNEPFYIGIGKKIKKFNSYRSEYARAFLKARRSGFWNNITSKTFYEVEIIFECDTFYKAKEKEKEFIKLYGRKNLNLGSLVNLTDGGDGTEGYIMSKENRQKLKKSKIGIFLPKTSKELYRYNCDTGDFIKRYANQGEASRELGIKGRSCFSKIKNNYAYNSLWYYNYQGKRVQPYLGKRRKFCCKIIMINAITKVQEKIFDDISEAYKFLGRNHGGLIRRSMKNGKLAYGYKWEEMI